MNNQKLDSVITYLRRYLQPNFYGTVSLRFDAGRVVLVNVQQAFKPETIQTLISQEETKPRSSCESTQLQAEV